MLDGGIVSGPASAGAIGSVVSTTLKISTIVYELKAVGEQTRDLLNSTQHVSNNLQTARTLRRQKSMHFDSNEKKWIDSVLSSTDKTLNNVASLIEPARVDMQTKFGSVGFINRGLFVFRDSPKVQTHLARLSIASGSLDAVLNVLCAREGRAILLSPSIEGGSWADPAKLKRKSCASLRSEASGPPAYQDFDYPVPPLPTVLEARRRQTLRRGTQEAIIMEPSTSLEEEIASAVADRSPIVVTEQAPLCSATWSSPPAELPVPMYPELEGSSGFPSHVFHLKREPTVQVQELPGCCSPQPCTAYHPPDPSNIRPCTASTRDLGSTLLYGMESYSPDLCHGRLYTAQSRDLNDRLSSMTFSSAPPLSASRSSMSSIRSCEPTVVSNASTFSAISEEGMKPSGRQRGGLGWLIRLEGRIG